ncbi:MAG TPA: oxidoreductase [Nocardioidaceae bacterium]|nr:oxidoreductase [Nocardioidaceae bacterium]
MKNAHQWTLDDIPDLTGKRALVTGVTSGLGEHTVLEMARKGASVVMAARSETKLRGAVDDVKRVLPNAELIPLVMDLADLGSVRRAVDEVKGLGPLDILINNAGVMATPYHRTVDGFELQFGTNHLGHFALTGQLFPQLAAAESARVVTVASQAHRYVRSVPLTDPRTGNGHYRKWIAYGQSKLANLLFAFELDRRARAAGTAVRSMAAHPGYAATNLMHNGLNMGGVKADGAIVVGATRLLAQPSEIGAQPSLMAATMPGLPGGSYCGPRGFAEMRGRPTVVTASRVARDETLARELWKVSEEATRVHFP